jgi:hypothetical protein
MRRTGPGSPKPALAGSMWMLGLELMELGTGSSLLDWYFLSLWGEERELVTWWERVALG